MWILLITLKSFINETEKVIKYIEAGGYSNSVKAEPSLHFRGESK